MTTKEHAMEGTYKASYQAEKTISIRKYLSLSEDERKALGAIEIIAPSLGSSSMGKLRITPNSPYSFK